MKKWLFILVIQFCLAGRAEIYGAITGNYEGSFRGRNNQSGKMYAQVVAQAGGNYRAIIRIGKNEPDALGGIISGAVEGDTLFLKGRIDLWYDSGGAYFVNAFVAGGEMLGNYSGGAEIGTISLMRAFYHSPTMGKKPPPGAVVLFDGTNLDHWKSAKGGLMTWTIGSDGELRVGKGNIISKERFGDCNLHLEFRTPMMPDMEGQKRGNSGLYLQGRYEIQILDSFGQENLNNGCGAIYKIAAPQKNCSLPPLEWQTYDVQFRAAKFKGGQKIRNAVITLYHNGELVHDNIEIPGPTGGALSKDEFGPEGIMLQEHKDAVQFRNIWVLPED